MSISKHLYLPGICRENRSFLSLKIDALLRQRTAKWSKCTPGSTVSRKVWKVAESWQLHANIREVFARRRGLLRQLVEERARGQSELERVLLSRLFSFKPGGGCCQHFRFPPGYLFALDAPLEPRGDAITIEIKPSRVVFRWDSIEEDFFSFLDWSTHASDISFSVEPTTSIFQIYFLCNFVEIQTET